MRIRTSLGALCIAASVALSALSLPSTASAQSEASAALSMLPVASVVGAASVAGAAAGSVVALPAALSVGGAMLTVVAVEASVGATIYLLERASDGARVSIRVSGQVAQGASMVAGTAVAVSVISTGVVLSVAGEVLAFIPNALGRALLHNERLT